MRIKRIDERLAEFDAPQLVSDGWDFCKDDVLICCAGFEDRSVEFLKQVHLTGESKVIIVDYLPLISENRLQEAREHCAKYGCIPKFFSYDRRNPAGGAEKIVDTATSSRGRIYIDISGMSRLLIVQIVAGIFVKYGHFDRIIILYAEAKTYPPEREEVQQAILGRRQNARDVSILLSSGVFEVTVVPELSSLALEGQAVRLIAFPAFNTDQLDAVRSEIQPSKITFINGKPPSDINSWRESAIRELNGIENVEGREEISVSTLDYRQTLSAIIEIYRKYGANEKLVIAPTGSKMQTVAVGIIRAYLRDIQIVYPTPRIFTAAKYTEGVEKLYSLKLDSFSAV